MMAGRPGPERLLPALKRQLIPTGVIPGRQLWGQLCEEQLDAGGGGSDASYAIAKAVTAYAGYEGHFGGESSHHLKAGFRINF